MASHSSAVTARLPSSTKRPTSSRREAVIQAMAVLGLGRQQLRPAAAERHAQQGDGEEPGDEREDRPIGRRPNDADPFADPERAEGAEQHTDSEFEGVLGNFGQRAVQDDAQKDDDEQRGDGAGAMAKMSRFGAEGGLLVVQRDDAGSPQDRFAQPAQAEQQKQRADDQLHDIDGDAGERRAEEDHYEEEHAEAKPGAEQGRTPAAHHTDGENDSQRFDELDERGEECRRHGRPRMRPGHQLAMLHRQAMRSRRAAGVISPLTRLWGTASPSDRPQVRQTYQLGQYVTLEQRRSHSPASQGRALGANLMRGAA